MDEQITKKDSLMPYLEEWKKINTKPKFESIKTLFITQLNTLNIPMARVIEKFDSYNLKIVNHWKEFGQNYDINPSLSLVPILQDSFSDYITIRIQEREILVDFIKELLTKANEFKETSIPKIEPKKTTKGGNNESDMLEMQKKS